MRLESPVPCSPFGYPFAAAPLHVGGGDVAISVVSGPILVSVRYCPSWPTVVTIISKTKTKNKKKTKNVPRTRESRRFRVSSPPSPVLRPGIHLLLPPQHVGGDDVAVMVPVQVS